MKQTRVPSMSVKILLIPIVCRKMTEFHCSNEKCTKFPVSVPKQRNSLVKFKHVIMMSSLKPWSSSGNIFGSRSCDVDAASVDALFTDVIFSI